jgi:hypothetical protein
MGLMMNGNIRQAFLALNFMGWLVALRWAGVL